MCTVIRCNQPGTETLELGGPDSVKRSTSVCGEHLALIEGGDEWVWRVEKPETDQNPFSYGQHVVYMGQDLVQLNEWVLVDSEGLSSSLKEASSANDDGYWKWTLVARQRGKEHPEKLSLVLKMDELREWLGLDEGGRK